MYDDVLNDYDDVLYNDDDIIRSFEEFDEKLPVVAKVIVRRGINFSLLTGNDDDGFPSTERSREAFQSVYVILREMVACISEMTQDELEHHIDVLLTACELVVMVNDGLA